MFKVRDDSKVLAWREKVSKRKADFAAMNEDIGRQGGGSQLCIPSSGQYSGSYGEEGFRGSTTYVLKFEPHKGCSVRITGTVQDDDGMAHIEVYYHPLAPQMHQWEVATSAPREAEQWRGAL